MKNPKLIYVEWQDINTHVGPWCDPDEVKPSACRSLGWLLCDEDSHITISTTFSDHDADDGGHREALGCSAIPRGCITKMEVLTLETLLEQRA